MAMQVKANAPSAGQIQWTDVRIQYKGKTHTVPNGYTDMTYVFWLYADPTSVYVSNEFPTVTADDVILFINKMGVPLVVPNTQVIDGSLVVPGSITANAIAADTISATHIVAGTISSSEIAANAIGADKIAANSIIANHINSLNGLNVGNGQFVVDANGNVSIGGTLNGASGTFTGNLNVVGPVSSIHINENEFKHVHEPQGITEILTIASGEIKFDYTNQFYGAINVISKMYINNLGMLYIDSPLGVAFPSGIDSQTNVKVGKDLVLVSKNLDGKDMEIYLSGDTLNFQGSLGKVYWDITSSYVNLYTDRAMFYINKPVTFEDSVTFGGGGAKVIPRDANALCYKGFGGNAWIMMQKKTIVIPVDHNAYQDFTWNTAFGFTCEFVIAQPVNSQSTAYKSSVFNITRTGARVYLHHIYNQFASGGIYNVSVDCVGLGD